LEALERGGEIIAASRGSLVGGTVRSDVFGSRAFMRVALMSVGFPRVRGGSQWFRRGGLCVLGSVYYGRGAGVVVVFRCHGFKTGFKIAGVAVVQQVHSLRVSTRSCATHAGRGISDCWRGL